MRVASVSLALPRHYYDQAALIEVFQRLWGGRFHNPSRLQQIHANVLVGGRHLALPLEEYARLSSFTDTNDAYIRVAAELGEEAARAALARAGLRPQDVDHIFFVSITGLATPSLDAKLANRMGMRRDVKRTPIFGLGCVAGAAGVARAADYVRAYPDQVALVVSVELCSLTLQRDDASLANVVAAGLFGDAAAAAVIVGAERGERGPEVVTARAVLFPHTEELMGWDIGAQGFRLVLSAEVPRMATQLRPEVERLLAEQGLCRGDVDVWLVHAGGPKVLQGVEEALCLPRSALALSWESLAQLGNVSSASVLAILEAAERRAPLPGSLGLMMAFGPGFSCEMVLLRW